MTDEDSNPDWVGLAEAIEALRDALVAAWWDGQQRRVRFKVEPVELTMQVGVTRARQGVGGDPVACARAGRGAVAGDGEHADP